MTLESLLAEGRKVLTAKEAQAERQAEEHRAAMSLVFGVARNKALELLAPLGDTVPVEPCVAWDGFSPNYRDNELTFYARPFGTGRVSVRLRYSWTGSSKEWVEVDSRCSYYVDSRFCPSRDGEPSADNHEVTNSLPEALALCERFSGAWREAKAKAEAAKARAPEQPAPPKQSTPDERLLEALRRWHGTLRHES